MLENAHKIDSLIPLLEDIEENTEIKEYIDTLEIRKVIHNLKKGLSIAFGGNFSSGKSTLINALVGESYLPMAKIPETGTICKLRKGDTNKIVLSENDRSREINYSKDKIKEYVSLIDRDTGSVKKKVLSTNQLLITCKNFNLPSQLTIIDSPGINDSGEMDERAMEAIKECDILYWVLRSDHILTEYEQSFLKSFIHFRGDGQLKFIINVFIDSDDEEYEYWDQFQKEHLIYCENKINDFCFSCGIKECQIFVVASKPALINSEDRFGLSRLRENIISYNSEGIGISYSHSGVETQANILNKQPLLENSIKHQPKNRVSNQPLSMERQSIALEKLRKNRLFSLVSQVNDFIDIQLEKEESSYSRSLELHQREVSRLDELLSKNQRHYSRFVREFYDVWKRQEAIVKAANVKAGTLTINELWNQDKYIKNISAVIKSPINQMISELYQGIKNSQNPFLPSDYPLIFDSQLIAELTANLTHVDVSNLNFGEKTPIRILLTGVFSVAFTIFIPVVQLAAPFLFYYTIKDLKKCVHTSRSDIIKTASVVQKGLDMSVDSLVSIIISSIRFENYPVKTGSKKLDLLKDFKRQIDFLLSLENY